MTSENEVVVPTGPLVSYGRLVGALAAPGTGLGGADVIGARIVVLHLLAAAAVVALAPLAFWHAAALSASVMALGILAAGRYTANCVARHQKRMIELQKLGEEEDFEVHEI